MKNLVLLILIILAGVYVANNIEKFQIKTSTQWAKKAPPVEVNNSINAVKYITALKKYYALLNTTLNSQDAEADSVWQNIKNGLSVTTVGDDFLVMNDGVTLTYQRNSNICSSTVSCAYIIIDTNGDNIPNSFSTGDVINDRFRLLVYSNRVSPESGSIEESILNK